MSDLRLIAKHDGTDIELLGVDFVGIDGFENMPLLGLYGGNVEESTKTFNVDELRFDWWGNDLFDFENPAVQMNSRLERSLQTIALNSAGRIEIEEIIKKDLEFLTIFAELEVSVSIPDVDRLEISIKLTEPDNKDSNEFLYIWNASENELSEV